MKPWLCNYEKRVSFQKCKIAPLSTLETEVQSAVHLLASTVEISRLTYIKDSKGRGCILDVSAKS